jgi:hypothetical protein
MESSRTRSRRSKSSKEYYYKYKRISWPISSRRM